MRFSYFIFVDSRSLQITKNSSETLCKQVMTERARERVRRRERKGKVGRQKVHGFILQRRQRDEPVLIGCSSVALERICSTPASQWQTDKSPLKDKRTAARQPDSQAAAEIRLAQSIKRIRITVYARCLSRPQICWAQF